MTKWKLVPVEPTEEMKVASSSAVPLGWLCWSAMLAAAPPPVVTDEMVKRAKSAWIDSRSGCSSLDEAMRFALTAALGIKDE